VIFDEIHKYRHWKNYLKGVYDQFGGEYRFLVTGSGRFAGIDRILHRLFSRRPRNTAA